MAQAVAPATTVAPATVAKVVAYTHVLCSLKITPFIQINHVAVVIATHRTKQHSIAHARTHARTQHSASPGWVQAAVANSSHENGACRSYGSVLFAQGKKQ